MIRQCAILCGGLGTRLGDLTRAVPKPLLLVDGRPFLDVLLSELGRQGFRHILLLAAFKSEKISAYARESEAARRFGMTVDVAIEPENAGTGGAVWHARDLLDDTFLLLNGDSWLDTPVRRLDRLLQAHPESVGAIALRQLPSAGRYGTVRLEGTQITSFAERPQGDDPALINGGIYAFARDRLIERLSPVCSLEADVLPGLAEQSLLQGEPSLDGYFIDIGVPEAYERAQTEVPKHLRRPAIFLDRDGVLNVNHGYVGTSERFDWIEGAREAVALANRLGYFVFVVTNQAGIGRGYYSEDDFKSLFEFMNARLSEHGAHLDDVRWCPHHPEAGVGPFKKACDWRKPEPGMILDLVANWPIDTENSFMVGDKDSDVLAAKAAGIDGYLFEGGNLLEYLRDQTPLGAAAVSQGIDY